MNKEKVERFKKIVEQFSNLTSVLDEKYYSVILKQLEALSKDHSTHISPIFLWFLRDERLGTEKLRLLETDLQIVFSATIQNRIKKHIIGQLKTFNALDTVFELSVISALIKALPKERIQLFPKTNQNHDVEMKVKLVDRWVYIEVTILNEAKEEADEISEMLRSGQILGEMKPVDMNKGFYRIVGKSQYKSVQFLPDSPNLLILAELTTLSFLHDFPEIDTRPIQIANIGAIMRFNYDFKFLTFQDGVESCQLTEEEKKILKEIFR